MDNKNSDVTRIVYYLNDQETPYLTKINVAPDEITLADFKNSLEINTKIGFKFFFKSQDAEVGIVKEEIIEDNAKLPLFKRRVVAWLVPSDGTNLSDRSNSQSNGIASSNSNLMNHNLNGKFTNCNRNLSYDTSDCDTTETESMMSNRRGRKFNGHHNSKNHFNHCCNESIGLTSDIDSTTFVDTDDESYYHCPNRKYDDDDYDNDLDDDCDNQSNFSTTSEETSISKVAQNRLKKKKRMLQLAKIQARASSAASIDSVESDIIPVGLNLTQGSFLGISIYGQCYSNGDNGIYVGSIMEKGVVQQDGRIDEGDMILQVNDVNFKNLSNDEAVAALRKAVSKLGPITLFVAKHRWLRSLKPFNKPFDESTEETLNLKNQPVRPIDPKAWVEHTRQINRNSKATTLQPEIDINNIQLTTNMEMLSIARAMSAPDSGLEIKDRTWLKITFPNSFLGSDVVNWLHSYVQGFKSRKEAKKYAINMLKNGYIRHTLNKSSFSEQCYYTLSDSVVFIPSMDNSNEDSNEKTEINFGIENTNNPSHQFLPWAQNTVSYGVFESCPSLQETNQQSNFHVQSLASSCSDQLSQTSGPIHISQFQMRNQQPQQLFNYSNPQQQAQSLLHHPPFASQPPQQHHNQSSNFFKQQFEPNHLRTASSNSSETQSSLNTLSTRDTAIGVKSNNQSNNALQNLTTGLSNLLSNNSLVSNGSTNNLPTNHQNGLNSISLSSNLSNNLPNNLHNNLTFSSQHDNHLMNSNGLSNNAFNMGNSPKINLNNHPSLNNGSNFIPN